MLVITAEYPFPPRYGSSIVAYHQLRELSSRHSIYLLCGSSQAVGHAQPNFLSAVEVVPRAPLPRPVQWLRVLKGATPSVARADSPAMQARVAELTAMQNFDAVLVYELVTVQYCSARILPKTLAHLEDPQSIRMRRMSELPLWSPLRRLVLSLHAAIIRRYEATLLSRLGRVLLLSAADMQDLIAEQGLANVAKVSYGIDVPRSEDVLPLHKRTQNMIVFSGNMFHPPNVDGACFFLERIFPLVLRMHATAELWIVGADPDPRIRTAAALFGERVTITGRVADVAAFVRRACVSVCPVRLKIGVQTKVLEALSWGTPVVVTSAGNSGVQAASGEELWVADEPGQFAAHVVSLLRGEQWLQLSQAGRRLVAQRFSWQQSAAELEEQLVALQEIR